MNTTSTQPLQVCIERHLRTLGYEICGDDDSTGWYWRFGNFTSRAVTLPLDTIDEATCAALLDLMNRTRDLLASSELVLQHWESGDLAAAVRDLAVSVAALTETGAGANHPTPASVAPVDADLILDAHSARIGCQAWLVQVDSAEGPWVEDAHLNLDSAITQVRNIAQGWLADGHAIDLDEVESALRANLEFSVPSIGSVRLTRIEVLG